MKRLLIFLWVIFVLPTLAFSQKQIHNSFKNDNFIEDLMKLPYRQLYDTANYYFDRKSSDTALICYNLLINIPVKNKDFEQKKYWLKH